MVFKNLYVPVLWTKVASALEGLTAIKCPVLASHVTVVVCLVDNGKTSAVPGMDAVDQAIAFKRELLEKIERFGDKLPPNTIDELIDSLGGTENVAEVSCAIVCVCIFIDYNSCYKSLHTNDMCTLKKKMLEYM